MSSRGLAGWLGMTDSYTGPRLLTLPEDQMPPAAPDGKCLPLFTRDEAELLLATLQYFAPDPTPYGDDARRLTQKLAYRFHSSAERCEA